MKTIKFKWGVFFSVVICMVFSSCGNLEIIPEMKPINPETPDGEEYVMVDFKCGGEFLEIEESPLGGRAVGEDVYMMEVLTVTGEVDPIGKEVLKPYAIGFMPSLDDVKLRLLKGKTYRFRVCVVIDGVKKGFSMFDNHSDIVPLATEFEYSATKSIASFEISWSEQFDYDRFYGELDKYEPNENTTIVIDTKRVSYGVKIIAEDLEEGVLNIEVAGEGGRYLISLTPESAEYESIYSFYNLRNAWLGKRVLVGTDPETGQEQYETVNYDSDKTLTVSWTRSNGDVIPLGDYMVNFKRNVKTTIRIKVDDTAVSKGIVIRKEENEMVDDENEYVIEGGELVEMPVTGGD